MVTYICVARDPRDVAISWAHFQDNMNVEALMTARGRAVGNDDLAELLRDWEPSPTDPLERFWRWVDEPPDDELARVNLATTMHHLATFWERRSQSNVVLVHYADLERDLEGEMRRVAQRLGIAIDEQRLPGLVDAARFESMRARADDVVPNSSEAVWLSNEAFFHRGVSGQWQALLDEADGRRYAQRVTQLAPTDLIHWAHQGSLEND